MGLNIHNSAQYKNMVNGGALTFKTYSLDITDGPSTTVLWLNSLQNGQPTLEIGYVQVSGTVYIDFWCRINGTGTGAPTFKLVTPSLVNYYNSTQGVGLLNRTVQMGDTLTFAGWQNSNHDIYWAYADSSTNHQLNTIGYFPSNQFSVTPSPFLMQIGGEVIGPKTNPRIGMGSGIMPPNTGAASMTGYTVDTNGSLTSTLNTDYTYNNDCHVDASCCYNIMPDPNNINNILYGGPGNCVSVTPTPTPVPSACNPVSCPSSANFCITGACIPKKYVIYGGIGFGGLFVLSLLKKIGG